MKIEMIAVDRLIPYARNPRRNDGAVDAIAASIKEFGFRQPIVVDEEMVILVGHTRHKAAQKLGMTEAPVHVATGLTETQKKAYRIADNRSNEIAEWDNDILALELEDLRMDDFDLGVLAFDDEELDSVLLSVDSTPEGLTDEDEVPELPVEPVTKPGDVWILGMHRLMCGDSTSVDAVDTLMAGATVDMVYTDPPYGISIVGGTGNVGGHKAFGTVGGCNIIKANSYAPIAGDNSIETAVKAIQVIKTLGAKVEIIWGGNYYANALDNSPCWIVWDKDNTGNFADAELAWTNQKTAVRIFKHTWNGMIKASEHGQKRVHPTQKPVRLAEWCFDQYGGNCKTVLDLFCGSGSTMLACETSGKAGFMMELSPAYVDVAVKRWQDYTGKVATLESTGESFSG